jgi:hypothetical protein
MRATEFIEDMFGTHPKRPQRKGTRPARGHEPVPRYRPVDEKKSKPSLRNPEDNPCWTGYKPVGTKQKNGRTVPNCVPKE